MRTRMNKRAASNQNDRGEARLYCFLTLKYKSNARPLWMQVQRIDRFDWTLPFLVILLPCNNHCFHRRITLVERTPSMSSGGFGCSTMDCREGKPGLRIMRMRRCLFNA